MAMIVTMHMLIDEDNSLDAAVELNSIMREAMRAHPKLADYAFSAIMRNGRQDQPYPYDPQTYEQGEFAHALKREI